MSLPSALSCGFDLGSAPGLAGAGIGLSVGSAPIFTSNCGGLVITVAVGCCVALGGCCACAPQKASVLPTSSVLSSVFFILFVV